MLPILHKAHRQPSGFSIIELLVAMAVFLLIAVVVANIVGSTAQITGLAKRLMGAEAAANQTFDRMTSDFQRAILRPDLPDRIEKRGVNDLLVFYAQGDAYEGDRGISSIAYDVAYGNGTQAGLMRGVGGYFWQSGNGTQLPFAGVTPARPSEPEATEFAEDANPERPSDDDFEVLGPGVFRFEVVFLLKDGTLSTVPVMQPSGVDHEITAGTSPSTTTTAGYSAGSRWFRPSTPTVGSRTFICKGVGATSAVWKRLGWDDVAAVVVGIAVIDPETLRSYVDILTPAKLAEMAAVFADAENGKDLLEVWSGTGSVPQWEAGLAGLDLPPPVLRGIRVRQHAFHLGR